MSLVPRSRWVLGLAAFTLAGVLFGTQFYLSSSQMGGTSPPAAFIADQLMYWYTWGALFPLVLALYRRVPPDQAPRVRALLIHAAAGIVAAYLHAGVYLALSHLVGSVSGVPFASGPWLEGLLRLNMPMRVVNYYLFVAGLAAVTLSQKNVERTVAASRLEAELARARERVLRAQMRPHFLFNALNAVAGLVRAGEGKRAVAMLAGVSDLLRRSLDHGDEHLVPLATELAFVRRYLEIEEVRFSDRLRVTVEVPAALEALPVPCFVLQPLVENAVLHGIARRPGAGVVRVGAERADGVLRLVVEDDGAGLAGDWSMARDAGIGLRNTAERLRTLYGEAGRLALRPSAAGGVAAEVAFPCAAPGGEER